MNLLRRLNWGITPYRLCLLILLLLAIMFGQRGMTGVDAAGNVNITINPQNELSEIEPTLYGINYHPDIEDALEDTNLVSRRFGGNRSTGYNWETNHSYSGTDYAGGQNDDFVCSQLGSDQSACDTSGGLMRYIHQNYLGGESQWYSLTTLPMAGYVEEGVVGNNGEIVSSYVSGDSDSFNSLNTNPYEKFSRFDQVVYDKSTAPSTTPNLNDNKVYIEEYLNFLISQFGTAQNGGIEAYSLDNEPGLWAFKHPHLRTPHSGDLSEDVQKVKVGELIDKSTRLASLIRQADSNAQVHGPISFGWGGYIDLSAAADYGVQCANNSTWFLGCYVDKMGDDLDVLDIHWYPEAYAGERVIQDHRVSAGSDLLRRLRMQSTRELWGDSAQYKAMYDSTNGIATWIFDDLRIQNHMPLLENLQDVVSGTDVKLAVTEFSPGGEIDVSGGIATADILGAFGEYGVSYSTFWQTHSWDSAGESQLFIPAAYKLYRNYDGALGTYGDIAVSADSNDPNDSQGFLNSSVYASVDSNTGDLHIIVLNKNLNTSMQGQINVTNAQSGFNVDNVWGFTDGNAALRTNTGATISDAGGNLFNYSVPPLSAHHFVLSSDGEPPVVEPPADADCVVDGFDPADMAHRYGDIQYNQPSSEFANGRTLGSGTASLWQQIDTSLPAGTEVTFSGNFRLEGSPDFNIKLVVDGENHVFWRWYAADTSQAQSFEISAVVPSSDSTIELDVWFAEGGHLHIGDFELVHNGTCEPEPTSATLGGVVYQDTNGNGIQDSGESPGAAVLALFRDADCDGAWVGNDSWVANTEAAANGAYTFGDLMSGDCYFIQAFQGDTLQHQTESLTLSGGSNVADIPIPTDAPPQPSPATLGGVVYQDANGNGIQDSGESPGAAVLALFRDADCDGAWVGNDSWVANTEAAANGAYTFGDLMSGDCYFIQAFQGSDLQYQTESLTLISGSNVNDIPVAGGDPPPSGGCSVDGFDPAAMAHRHGSLEYNVPSSEFANGRTLGSGTASLWQQINTSVPAGTEIIFSGNFRLEGAPDFNIKLIIDGENHVFWRWDAADTGDAQPFEITAIAPSATSTIELDVWFAEGGYLHIGDFALTTPCNA